MGARLLLPECSIAELPILRPAVLASVGKEVKHWRASLRSFLPTFAAVVLTGLIQQLRFCHHG